MTTPEEDENSLKEKILDLLALRDPGRTICPSDAARAVYADRGGSDDGWRELMEPARRAAGHLVEAGRIVVMQGGETVELGSARGPIRLRLL